MPDPEDPTKVKKLGHYSAFISPKADNEWIKLNDHIVSKSTPESAIQGNYGGGSSTANAYMLVYIRDSSIAQTICDIVVPENVPKPKKVILENDLRHLKVRLPILKYVFSDGWFRWIIQRYQRWYLVHTTE